MVHSVDGDAAAGLGRKGQNMEALSRSGGGAAEDGAGYFPQPGANGRPVVPVRAPEDGAGFSQALSLIHI